MSYIVMAQLDRMLRLKRGAANQLRKRGVFEATQIAGRLWAVTSDEYPAVKQAIEDYRSGPEEDGLLPIMEAANRLAIAPSTVYNLIRLGRLESVETPNGRRYVRVRSVEQYRARRLPPGVGIKLGRKPR